MNDLYAFDICKLLQRKMLTVLATKTWRQIVSPSKEQPSERLYHSVVIAGEGESKQMLVLGGFCRGSALNDLWSLNLSKFSVT